MVSRNSGGEAAQASAEHIARLRADCRRMVRRRAVVACGLAAIPLPGVAVLSDASLFALLVEDINRAFGLSHEQVKLLQPRLRVIAYEAAAGVGGVMVGKLITRELVLQLFKRAGMRRVAGLAARAVPIAGQIASAALGFAVFRAMGDQHVDACVMVAQQLGAAAPAPRRGRRVAPA